MWGSLGLCQCPSLADHSTIAAQSVGNEPLVCVSPHECCPFNLLFPPSSFHENRTAHGIRETMSSISWTPDWLESQDSSSWAQRIKSIVLTLFYRIRRGGLGLLLKATGVVITLAVFYQLVPQDISQRYRHVTSWAPAEETKGPGLRIVAFGSQDLMGSATDSVSDRLTWPQRLCDEV